MDIAPGTLVTSALLLVRPLGQGGMGSVWLADHLALKTHVAVKFLTEKSLADESSVARFASEAAAAARIRSPHVVQVFDYGTADGVPYIVMEQLEGEDLAALLAKGKRLEPGEIVRIVEQIAQALAKAHGMGIVHRDIKPANIFLTRPLGDEGEVFVKVLDFGLAKMGPELAPAATKTDAVFGTPAYMSPEQAESSRDVTPQSDLWSLAVVAYHALTGALPFVADTLMGLCIAIHEAKFDPPTTRRTDLPPAVDAFFDRALRRDPGERFASALELSSSFRMALAGDYVDARRPAGRGLKIAIAVAAAAILGAAAWAIAPASRPRLDAIEANAPEPPVDVPAEPAAFALSPPTTTTPAEPSGVASLAPLLPASAQPPPAPRFVRVVSTRTNGLYSPSHVRAVMPAYYGAVLRCFARPGLDLQRQSSQIYTLTVATSGAVTSVVPTGTGNRDAVLDACMASALAAVAFGPTDAGAGGEVVVGLGYSTVKEL